MARAKAEEIKDIQPIDEQPIEPEAKAEEIENLSPKKPKEWKILAPNKEYTGVAATVEFKNGVGHTSNEVIKNYFESKGFQIV